MLCPLTREDATVQSAAFGITREILSEELDLEEKRSLEAVVLYLVIRREVNLVEARIQQCYELSVKTVWKKKTSELGAEWIVNNGRH